MSPSFCHTFLKDKNVSVLVQDRFEEQWLAYGNVKACFSIGDLSKEIISKEPAVSGVDVKELMCAVQNDYRTYILLERYKSAFSTRSSFNDLTRIYHIVLNSIYILKTLNVDRLVFPSTPHSNMWFVAKVADAMNIQILTCPVSPLSWKRWVVEGLNSFEPVRLLSSESDKMKIIEWQNSLKHTYENAVPEYEKERLRRFKNNDFNVITHIVNCFNIQKPRMSLRELMVLPKKLKLLFLYRKKTADFQLPKHYYFFPLHYQPERTTLPEGKNYAHQFRLVLEFLQCLPTGSKLVVKEHPSTFRNSLNPRFRDEIFFRSLVQLDNVVLAPLNFDQFELIDNAKGVIAITGTVAYESVARNTPVLFYGRASYKGMPGTFDENELEEFLSSSLESHTTIRGLTEYFEEVDKISYTKVKRQYDAPSIGALKCAFEC